jgi:threonine dehydratase
VIAGGGIIALNMLSKILERGQAKDGGLTHLKVVLPDKPGGRADLSVLLAGHRANVLHMVHERSFSQANLGEGQVTVTLETRGHEHAQAILTSLSQTGFRVVAA